MGGHSVGIVSGYDTTIVRWRTKEVRAMAFAVGDATIYLWRRLYKKPTNK
jgi:hypothetical protein